MQCFILWNFIRKTLEVFYSFLLTSLFPSSPVSASIFETYVEVIQKFFIIEINMGNEMKNWTNYPNNLSLRIDYSLLQRWKLHVPKK